MAAHLKRRGLTRDAVTASGGNIFADLGRPDADELLCKARLAERIGELLAARDLSQSAAAALLGIDQPKVSKLLRGRPSEFSTDRLFRFLTALDQDVEIVVRASRRSRGGGRLRVAAA